jgi:hypothetical protein
MGSGRHSRFRQQRAHVRAAHERTDLDLRPALASSRDFHRAVRLGDARAPLAADFDSARVNKPCICAMAVEPVAHSALRS